MIINIVVFIHFKYFAIANKFFFLNSAISKNEESNFRVKIDGHGHVPGGRRAWLELHVVSATTIPLAPLPLEHQQLNTFCCLPNDQAEI